MISTNPKTAAARIKKLSKLRPALAIVLGSGFQQAIARLKAVKEISYAELPGFPPVGVSGHAGKLVIGHLGGTAVAVLSGRAHFYEGNSMEQVTFAMRTMAEFGVKDVLLTNAAGGVNSAFRPGNFMVLKDHINLMGVNPFARPGPARFAAVCGYDAGL